MNIPEGADSSQMPAVFGAGRILSRPEIRERYLTIRLFGWRFFAACGFYGGTLPSARCWIQRDAVTVTDSAGENR